MSDKTVRVEIEGGVAVMTVSRPDKLNAFDLDMLKALDAACDIEARKGREQQQVADAAAGGHPLLLQADLGLRQ